MALNRKCLIPTKEPLTWWICLEACWKWWKLMPCMQILQWIPPEISSRLYQTSDILHMLFPEMDLTSLLLSSFLSYSLLSVGEQGLRTPRTLLLPGPHCLVIDGAQQPTVPMVVLPPFYPGYWSPYVFHKLGFWHLHGEWLHAIWGNKLSPQLWFLVGGRGPGLKMQHKSHYWFQGQKSPHRHTLRIVSSVTYYKMI